MNPTFSPATVAIVGGGAGGTLVAAQLLSQARRPLRVLLFERMSEVGRGVAYGPGGAAHLLNVPAGRMGAFPDRPGHFLAWVGARTGRDDVPAAVTGDDFLPRRLYGEYLRAVLDEAKAGAAEGVALEEIKAEVLDIDAAERGVRLRCGGGPGFSADRVVLAIGNLPGEYPIRDTLPVYQSPHYVHLPWSPGALAGIPPAAEVLLVGAGLTSIDLALALVGQGHTGVIHALSRRGLLPQEHRLAPSYPDFLAGETLPATVRQFSRRVRAEVRKARAHDLDWRPVLDALRPHTSAVWRNFSDEERARFLRHMRPFWEVHRHRVAPAVAARLAALREAGQLRFHAGRLTELQEREGGVEARFRLRGTSRTRDLRVAKVINCTGPRSDYSKYQHPLLINLLARGLIDHDSLALGINALPDGQILRRGGGPVDWLFTLGAPLKGILWECTSIPDIRNHARTLAIRLLEQGSEYDIKSHDFSLH